MAKVPVTEELVVKDKKRGDIVIDYSMVNEAAMTIRSINHPIRKKVVELLEDVDEMNVTEIYVQLRMEQSIVSQHLAILLHAKILKTRREGKFIYYRLNRKRIKSISTLLNKLAGN